MSTIQFVRCMPRSPSFATVFYRWVRIHRCRNCERRRRNLTAMLRGLGGAHGLRNCPADGPSPKGLAAQATPDPEDPGSSTVSNITEQDSLHSSCISVISYMAPHKACRPPDIDDIPPELQTTSCCVVLRGAAMWQICPAAARPSPWGSTSSGLAMGRSDLDRHIQCLARLGLAEPRKRSSGPTGLRVIWCPDAVTVRLISWTLTKWNRGSTRR